MYQTTQAPCSGTYASSHLANALDLRLEHHFNFRKLALCHLRNTIKASNTSSDSASNLSNVAQANELIDNATISFLDEYGMNIWPGHGRFHLTTSPYHGKTQLKKGHVYQRDADMDAKNRRGFRGRQGREPTAREKRLKSPTGAILREFFRVVKEECGMKFDEVNGESAEDLLKAITGREKYNGAHDTDGAMDTGAAELDELEGATQADEASISTEAENN